MHQLKASFIVPAYNESENLPRTLGELQSALRAEDIPYEIIVVNDNSADETGTVVRNLMREDPDIRLVDRSPPRGIGRAIREGIEHVQGDLVIVYMADSSDHPRDAVTYYRKIEEGYDCVFGSRFMHGSSTENYPRRKLFVNRLVNTMIRCMFMTKHNDLTNAFKAYRTHVIEACGPYKASHFNITIEMSLSALIREFTIARVPISWSGRTWGSSNLKLKEMGRRYLSTLLKIFFEGLLIRDDLLDERAASTARRAGVFDQLNLRVNELENRLQEIEDGKLISSRS